MPLPGPLTRTIVWPILRFTRRLTRLIPRYPWQRAKLSLWLQYVRITRSPLIVAKNVIKKDHQRKKPSNHSRSVLQRLDPKLLPTDDPNQGIETVFGKIVIRDPVNSIKFAYAAYKLLPADNLILWIDACVTKTGAVGVAVVVYEWKPYIWMREAIAGNIPSSTMAEAAAILKALDIAIGLVEGGVQTDRVHVFSDDLSGLNILKRFQQTALSSWMFPMLAERVRRLQSSGVDVSLHWVRGHSGVRGNSLADLAAAEFLKEASHQTSRTAITGRIDLEHALSLPLPAMLIESEVCRQDPKLKIQHNIKALESRLRGVPLDLGSKFRMHERWMRANSQALLDRLLHSRARRKARWAAIEQAAQRMNKKCELKARNKSGARGSANEVVDRTKAKPDIRASGRVMASKKVGIQYPSAHRLELDPRASRRTRGQHPASRRIELDLSTLRQGRDSMLEAQHDRKT